MMVLKSVVTEGVNEKYEKNSNSIQMGRKGSKRTASRNRRHKIRPKTHMQRQPRIEELQEKSRGEQNENGNKGEINHVLSCDWNDEKKQRTSIIIEESKMVLCKSL